MLSHRIFTVKKMKLLGFRVVPVHRGHAGFHKQWPRLHEHHNHWWRVLSNLFSQFYFREWLMQLSALSRINPSYHINTYFFKIHSNIILSSIASPLKFCENTPTFSHFGYMYFPLQSYSFIRPNYNSLMVQTMNFFVVKVSPLILIALGSKYSLYDLFFN